MHLASASLASGISTLSLHTKIRPADRSFPPSSPDMIELLQEGNFFFGIIKEVELDIAIDQAAEFDADEPDELAALIDIGEEFERVGDESAGLCGIGDTALFGKGVEVGIADLDGDTAGEAGVLPEVESEFVDHGAEHAADKFDIQGILAEGAFLGH